MGDLELIQEPSAIGLGRPLSMSDSHVSATRSGSRGTMHCPSLVANHAFTVVESAMTSVESNVMSKEQVISWGAVEAVGEFLAWQTKNADRPTTMPHRACRIVKANTSRHVQGQTTRCKDEPLLSDLR